MARSGQAAGCTAKSDGSKNGDGVQNIRIHIGIVLVSSAAYDIAFDAIPFIMRGLGSIPFLLLAPLLLVAALVVYTPIAVLIVVLVKRLLIGRYRPVRAPVWGSV